MKKIKAYYDNTDYNNLYFYIFGSEYMKKYGGKKIFTTNDIARACNSINGQRIRDPKIKDFVVNTIDSLETAEYYVTDWSLPKTYKALVRKFNVGRYKNEERVIRAVNSSVMSVLVIIRTCISYVFANFNIRVLNEDDEELTRSVTALIKGNTLSIITGYHDFPEFVTDSEVKSRIKKALEICDKIFHIKVHVKVMSGFFVFNVDLTYLFEQRELEEQWYVPSEDDDDDGFDPLNPDAMQLWLDKLPRADV